MSIIINSKHTFRGTIHNLPSSKSISNRALLIDALSGNQSVVSNLSVARDTVLMQSLVNSPDHVIDVKDAGTTMRFLTAYFALTGRKKILTGTKRMKERPIALLVDALTSIGAQITYHEVEGYPPIETTGFQNQKADSVSLPGDVSSQYISALMMMAPVLPRGLAIRLEGKVGSRPYIDMTASIMKEFGISCEFEGSVIRIPAGAYLPGKVTVEADWSAASYWFAFVALAKEAELKLPNVSSNSVQGDRAIVDAMKLLGVKTVFHSDHAVLSKQAHQQSIAWDFKDCPDLGQTILPVCAAKGIAGSFTGLESLRIKETDRIAALQTELGKFGAILNDDGKGHWSLVPGKPGKPISINTYHDHRMAMGLAPLATLGEVQIDDPSVVNKSYPGFWDDMKSLGFVIDSR